MLERILQTKRKEVAVLNRKWSDKQLQRLLGRLRIKTRSLAAALTSGRTPRLICEMKKKSPSKGILRRKFQPIHILREFQKSGATAISVLTDATYFHGKPGLIPALRPHAKVPLLRKDFLIDPIQIYESRLLGADAILLIVSILSKQKLRNFLTIAKNLTLEALVEVRNARELDLALEAGAQIVGINNRNLKTLRTNVRYAETLLGQIPANIIKIVESGIETPDDLARYRSCHVHGFLIGTALMRAPNIADYIRQLHTGYPHDQN